MKLAKAIYDNGKILLNTDVKNLYKYKERLLELGINNLYVEDKYSFDIEITPTIKDSTRRRGKRVIKNTFKKISDRFLNSDVKELKEVIKEISSELILNDDVLLNLVSLKKQVIILMNTA